MLYKFIDGLYPNFAAMQLPNFLQLHWQLLTLIGFCIAAFLQMFYNLVFFGRLAFYKDQKKTTSQTHPVSVIVCARDEAEQLSVNLVGILLQDYATTHEVIVVNDNSFDESKYILETLKKEFKQLQVVELTQEAKMIPGKKFPLSIGIKTAKHEIVLLTDADCVPATANWIHSMQAAYKADTEILLGYGSYQKRKGILNKVIRWETYHAALQYLSYALAGIPYMGVGRNLSYKKTVFFRHKGFSAHNKLPGGDDDLFVNAAATNSNTDICIDPQSFTISKPATQWGQWLAQKNRHYTTSKHYKNIHKFLLGMYASSQFIFYPLAITALFTYYWKITLAILICKLLLQGYIHFKVMHKLGEKDLFLFSFLADVWMFFYYLLFVQALFRKPRQSWR